MMHADPRELARSPARSLLGALLQSSEPDRTLFLVRSVLEPDDFPLKEGLFLGELFLRADTGQALDFPSLLHDALSGRLRFAEMRPDEIALWLGQLHREPVPSFEAIPGWIARVHDASRRRKAFLLIARASQAIESGEDPLAVLEESKKDLKKIGSRQSIQQSRLGSFLESSLQRMERRAKKEEGPVILPWPSLNRLLSGGLWPGLHLLVGNTGSGKSQLALQGALHAARNGVPVLYVGLELGEVDLVARLVGLRTQRRWSRLYLGQNGPEELTMLRNEYAEALEELSRIPFHLEVCPPMGWSYDQIYQRARALKEHYLSVKKPIFIVLDFLQLVSSPDEKHEELRERIGRAAYAGRAAARDLDAVVWMVSSTSRDNYAILGGEGRQKLGQGNPSRLVGLGKESGELEYAADSVMVLCRDPEAKPISEEWSPIWVALAKARAARPGWCELLFNGGWFMEPPSTGGLSL